MRGKLCAKSNTLTPSMSKNHSNIFGKRDIFTNKWQPQERETKNCTLTKRVTWTDLSPHISDGWVLGHVGNASLSLTIKGYDLVAGSSSWGPGWPEPGSAGRPRTFERWGFLCGWTPAAPPSSTWRSDAGSPPTGKDEKQQLNFTVKT